jgi:hypothetical protein
MLILKGAQHHCYLRGKQYELLAVRACISKIVQKNMTVIIEPVRESNRDLYSCLRSKSIQCKGYINCKP